MNQPMRILLADDHILFRKGLAGLIAARDDMQIVGEAGDGLQAIELARDTHPDVVLLDIHMPRCGGLDAIAPIQRLVPDARIVMLTVSEDDQDLFTAIKNGAYGYLLKDIEPADFFELLEKIRRGEAPIAGVMASKILREFRAAENRPAPASDSSGDLSARELEVLGLVANGATNRQIAHSLSITENTVKVHLRNILEKLHLQNRIQAAAFAIRQGLAVPPDKK